MTPNDSCVSRGATLGYDANADTATRKALKKFFAQIFKLTVFSVQRGTI